MTSFAELMKSTKKRKHALSNIQIQEVSLVKAPASTGANVSFIKSAGDDLVEFQKSAGYVANKVENRGPSDQLLDAVKGKQKPGETPYDTIARLQQDPELNAAYTKRRLSRRGDRQPVSTDGAVSKSDRLASVVQEQIQKSAASGKRISKQEALTRAVEDPELYRCYRELMAEGAI